MSKKNLNATTVANAKPKSKPYRIHDKQLTGFNLWVSPAGQKTYRVYPRSSDAEYHESIGDAEKISCDEAREIARKKIAAFRNTDYDSDTPFEIIAEVAFLHRKRLWKPSTREANRDLLDRKILPFFTGRAIGSITRSDVEKWFMGLSNTPGSANRALPVFSVIMRTAEDMGCIPDGGNPAKGFKRYKATKKERFLTDAEMKRLGAALAVWEGVYPSQVAFIRLLVLTGCRSGEVTGLKWRYYRGGHLYLPDSKTGPKTVFLSSPAREVLDGIERGDSEWVFPAKRVEGPNTNIGAFWNKLRAEIGLKDVRLHDLRHTYASIAIRSGENLRVVGKLLGHVEAETTLRYIHLDDSTMQEAVQTITTSMLAEREAAE